MPISFFVLVIEKTDSVYSGYTPNVSGALSTGNTREEVERSLLLQIEEHLEEIGSRHTTRLEVTTRPVEEKMECVEIIGAGHRYAWTCKTPARKEGLCWQHWKLRYGHAVRGSAGSRRCQLCEERDLAILSAWDAPCAFKATHTDWPDVLSGKRLAALTEKRTAAEKEKRRKMIEALPVQCAAIRTQGPKGVRCSNLAQRDGLCTNHWKLREN
jgi:predicted RNase H-like HicB family nuclease